MIRFFPSNAIVFYPLCLKEDSQENLRDFLEEKICRILNLKRDCEYFLKYCFFNGSYYCLLASKERLREYVKSADEVLTHPAFFTLQFLNPKKEYEYFVVVDTFFGLEITLVGYECGNMVLFQSFLQEEEALKKSYEILQKCPNASFYLWITNQEAKEQIPKMLKEERLEILDYDLSSLSFRGDFDFNPLEKTIPLRKQNIGKIFFACLAGVVFGLVYPLFLGVSLSAENKKQAHLQTQIKEQIHQIKEDSSKEEAFLLQEKLQKLQKHFDNNDKYLQQFSYQNPRFSPFFKKINPHLEKQKVKISYLGFYDKWFEVLLVGDRVLEFLQDLEAENLGVIEDMEWYGGWLFVRIKV